MKNKRAWIEIIEAFTAMLLIVAVVLILLNKNYSQQEDLSERAYDIQIAILREIELSQELREQITDIESEDLPQQWDEEGFPEEVMLKIRDRTPNPFTCVALICDATSSCRIQEGLGRKTVYVQSVLIYHPERTRRLKLFCYT